MSSSSPDLPRYGFASSNEDFAAWAAAASRLQLQAALAMLTECFSFHPDVVALKGVTGASLVALQSVDAADNSTMHLIFHSKDCDEEIWQAMEAVAANAPLVRETHLDILEKIHDSLAGEGAWQRGWEAARMAHGPVVQGDGEEEDDVPLRFPVEAFSPRGRKALDRMNAHLKRLALQRLGALMEELAAAHPKVRVIDYDMDPAFPLNEFPSRFQIHVEAPGLGVQEAGHAAAGIKKALADTLSSMLPSIPVLPFVTRVLLDLPVDLLQQRLGDAYEFYSGQEPGAWQEEKAAFEKDTLGNSISPATAARKALRI